MLLFDHHYKTFYCPVKSDRRVETAAVFSLTDALTVWHGMRRN